MNPIHCGIEIPEKGGTKKKPLDLGFSHRLRVVFKGIPLFNQGPGTGTGPLTPMRAMTPDSRGNVFLITSGYPAWFVLDDAAEQPGKSARKWQLAKGKNGQ